MKQLRFRDAFWVVLGCILESFWYHLGSKMGENESNDGANRAKMGIGAKQTKFGAKTRSSKFGKQIRSSERNLRASEHAS